MTDPALLNHLQSSGNLSPEMQASVNVRPNTAARNCFTPGPDNPVVSQVKGRWNTPVHAENIIRDCLFAVCQLSPHHWRLLEAA